MNTHKCFNCHKKTKLENLSSCSIGHIEIKDIIPMSKERLNKLCSNDSDFYCEDCMSGWMCINCSKELTSEEKELLENHINR